MKSKYFFWLILLIFPISCRAQIGVYSEYSAAKLNAPSANWVNGPVVGVYGDKGHWRTLHTGLDARGSFLFGGESTQWMSFLAGPRLAIQPTEFLLHPYLEGLFGMGHYQSGSTPKPGMGPAGVSDNKFEYQLLYGMDIPLTQSIDWRVIEFSLSQISDNGTSSHPREVSMGIVMHFH